MVTDDEREGLLSYIRHQVSKGPDGIRDAVEKGHAQLLGQLEGLSEEHARFTPEPDQWSIFEVLQHVLQGKRGVAGRCAALARGETIEGVAESGQRFAPLPSLSAARPALDAAHEELLAFIEGISPETNLEARSQHPFFGPLNCQEWAAFQRIHDGDHSGQIEQIKAATGFPPP